MEGTFAERAVDRNGFRITAHRAAQDWCVKYTRLLRLPAIDLAPEHRQEIEQKRRHLMEFLEGRPLPASAIEERLYVDAIFEVSPQDAAAIADARGGGAHSDPWSYIDALTGGCCNSLFHGVDSPIDYYQATVTPAQVVTPPAHLRLVAASPRLAADLYPYLQQETRDALKRVPRAETFDEEHRAEYKAWIDKWSPPRRAALLDAMSGATLIDPDARWRDLDVPNYRAGVDPRRNRLSICCTVEDEMSRLNNMEWQVIIEGTFDPNGSLRSMAVVDDWGKRVRLPSCFTAPLVEEPTIEAPGL
ncbi:MAG: hypothetical protein F9K47_09715 [Burkholderiales bacterium]|nr:MAG: hypothetical protein F9K47_09715 [Burkholderiales bacterium]